MQKSRLSKPKPTFRKCKLVKNQSRINTVLRISPFCIILWSLKPISLPLFHAPSFLGTHFVTFLFLCFCIFVTSCFALLLLLSRFFALPLWRSSSLSPFYLVLPLRCIPLVALPILCAPSVLLPSCRSHYIAFQLVYASTSLCSFHKVVKKSWKGT